MILRTLASGAVGAVEGPSSRRAEEFPVTTRITLILKAVTQSQVPDGAPFREENTPRVPEGASFREENTLEPRAEFSDFSYNVA